MTDNKSENNIQRNAAISPLKRSKKRIVIWASACAVPLAIFSSALLIQHSCFTEAEKLQTLQIESLKQQIAEKIQDNSILLGRCDELNIEVSNQRAIVESKNGEITEKQNLIDELYEEISEKENQLEKLAPMAELGAEITAEREKQERLKKEEKAKQERLAAERKAQLLSAKGKARTELANRGIPPSAYGRELTYAVKEKNHSLLRLLLDAEVNRNQCDDSILSTAVNNGDTESVKLLLESSLKIDVNRHFALNIAAARGHAEIVRLLLAAPGVDVNLSDTMSNFIASSAPQVAAYPPLCCAAARGHAECVRILLADSRVSVNKSNMNNTALSLAVSNGHTECVRELLSSPSINVNAGMPLLCAAANGRNECIQLLVAQSGIDVNISSYDGNTALFLAAQNGHVECVKTLLSVPGVSVNRVNSDGEKPLDVARGECANLLKNAVKK